MVIVYRISYTETSKYREIVRSINRLCHGPCAGEVILQCYPKLPAGEKRVSSAVPFPRTIAIASTA